MLGRRCLLSLSAAVAGIGLGRRNAVAADGVRLVCGFGAGNPTELCAQLINDEWSANLDQPVTFDYTIGEAGLLAAREVVESIPDGKTPRRDPEPRASRHAGRRSPSPADADCQDHARLFDRDHHQRILRAVALAAPG